MTRHQFTVVKPPSKVKSCRAKRPSGCFISLEFLQLGLGSGLGLELGFMSLDFPAQKHEYDQNSSRGASMNYLNQLLELTFLLGEIQDSRIGDLCRQCHKIRLPAR